MYQQLIVEGPLSDALLSNKGLQKAIGGYGVKSYVSQPRF